MNTSRHIRWGPALCIALGVWLLLQPVPTRAETITVTNTLDSGAGTLRQAIANAASGDTIVFTGSMSIYLNSELSLAKRLTIDGGVYTVTVSGDSGGDGSRNVRVFYIDSNGVVTLTHLNIVSGTTTGYGGGIYNDDGTLTLSDSTISSNSANQGGGMYNNGSSPTLTDVTFSANSASSGGGMYNTNNSSPTLTNVTFSGNWLSSVSGSGGGMYSASNSNPTLTNVTFSDNSAYGYGGGMFNYQNSPRLTNVTFNGNSVPYGGTYPHGGGMANQDSDPILTNVTFSGNSAYGSGGGMYNFQSSSLTLTNVTFISNTATAVGSGGGGMMLSESSAKLTNVTFSGNSASYGGGMYNNYSNPALTNVTFNGNAASRGGGIYNLNYCSPQVRNSILWGDAGTREIYNELSTSTPVISDSVVQGGCPSGATCTNVITTTPQLGPLGDYGGSTPTFALLPDSPAIDAGGGGCPATDQRGFPRNDLRCDIGAFELQHADSDTVIKTFGDVTTHSFGPTWVSVTLSMTDTGSITVTKHLACPGGGTCDLGELPATWHITSSLNAGLPLTVSFCYTQELAGVTDEGSLRAFRWDTGTLTWTLPIGTGLTVDEVNHCVRLTGVSVFSAWTLKDTSVGEDTPTAARVVGLAAWGFAPLGIILALGGAVTFFKRRQR